MADSVKFRNAMSSSVRLAQEGRHEQALKIVDEAVAKAVDATENSWVRTLCHHAAIIARHNGNLDLSKRYYDQSLASNPENSRALYGLAFIAREQGDSDAAKLYAEKCYRALTHDEEAILRDEWMDLLLRNWPEVASK
jgi:tetratricopeptide (TPR) repeat protein